MGVGVKVHLILFRQKSTQREIWLSPELLRIHSVK